MRLTKITLGLLVLLLIGAFALDRPPRLTHAQTDQTAGSPCCGEEVTTAPRQIEFPYYSLRDGFKSTLLLVSDSPKPFDLVLAVHSRSGQTILAPTMTIQPQEKLALDLAALLTSLSAGGRFRRRLRLDIL